MRKNYTLSLTNSPVAVKKGSKKLTRYTKELIKVGKYVKDSVGLTFEVTKDTLKHWADTFRKWQDNGLKVPIPLGHANADDPEKNQGWVRRMFVEGDALFGVLELTDPQLALTTDVSIYVPSDFTDGRGQKYIQPITHVALCTNPVIPGLKDFEQLSLSLGEPDMDTKKWAKLMGLPEDADEKTITTAITKVKSEADKIVDDTKALSQEPASDVLVKLVAENRDNKIANLVQAGVISPAIQKVIKEQYSSSEPLALTLSSGNDDGFDFLVRILLENKTVPLEEKSGHQLLELANVRNKGEENPVSRDIDKRIEVAKQKI